MTMPILRNVSEAHNQKMSWCFGISQSRRTCPDTSNITSGNSYTNRTFCDSHVQEIDDYKSRDPLINWINLFHSDICEYQNIFVCITEHADFTQLHLSILLAENLSDEGVALSNILYATLIEKCLFTFTCIPTKWTYLKTHRCEPMLANLFERIVSSSYDNDKTGGFVERVTRFSSGLLVLDAKVCWVWRWVSKFCDIALGNFHNSNCAFVYL